MMSSKKGSTLGGEGGTNEVENEYVDMQRKYKNMDNDRKAYNEETQAQLKKQKNMVEKL